MRGYLHFAVLALSFPGAAAAEPPALSFPLDCQLGKTCFIQQYVDHASNGDARDYTCGPLSYDGHRGTDIRIAHENQTRGAGFDVLAAAAGIVVATRDGLPDISQSRLGAPDIKGRECGNGVLIDHGGGWRSQYCHMRRSSIQVAKGDHVSRQAHLGKIGLSGKTEFPHLHIKITHDGNPVDPFSPEDQEACGPPAGKQLWATPIPYAPGGVLDLGFSNGALSFRQIRDGPDAHETLPPNAPALVFWAYFYGMQARDRIHLILRDRDGTIMAEDETPVPRNQAELFRLVGRKKGRENWSSGTYVGLVILTRKGRELARRSISVAVN